MRIFFQIFTIFVVNDFNKNVLDHPNVKYFSLEGGKPKWNSAVNFFYGKIWEEEGPNDGLVSNHSARWGNFLGSLGEDHFQQVGWTLRRDARFVYRAIVEVLVKEEPTYQIWKENVEKLVNLGFDREFAEEVLKMKGGDINAAANQLLDN